MNLISTIRARMRQPSSWLGLSVLITAIPTALATGDWMPVCTSALSLVQPMDLTATAISGGLAVAGGAALIAIDG